ncbi:hypothetical protein MMC11_006666 [Xylographa trunciseda]|nr:hypothetical protein [Xylographa trunciseda]
MTQELNIIVIVTLTKLHIPPRLHNPLSSLSSTQITTGTFPLFLLPLRPSGYLFLAAVLGASGAPAQFVGFADDTDDKEEAALPALDSGKATRLLEDDELGAATGAGASVGELMGVLDKAADEPALPSVVAGTGATVAAFERVRTCVPLDVMGNVPVVTSGASAPTVTVTEKVCVTVTVGGGAEGHSAGTDPVADVAT